MKRYIRTKCGAIHDTYKYKVNYDDVYTSEITLRLKTDETKGWVINKENIVKESDSILDLVQVGDLVEDNSFASLQFVTSSLIDLIEDRVENYNVKNPEDLGIYKLYTKQDDNYGLVWDSERGVV